MSRVRAAKKALRQSGLRVDSEELGLFTVVELKEKCRDLNVSTTGNKEALIERIDAHNCGETQSSPRARSRSRSPRSKAVAAKAQSPPPTVTSPRSASKRRGGAGEAHSEEEKETIEFGGPVGTVVIMLLSHCTLLYLWISWKFYDAALLYPRGLGDVLPWLRTMGGHVVNGGAPNVEAVTVYWSFLFVQGFLAWVIPGLKVRGLPIKHLGNTRLEYKCNGIFTWYLSLAIMAGLHFSGLWRLTNVFHNFGPLMSVAILTTDLIAVLLYVSAFVTGAAHRLSGNRVYDFFMGASLNPRLGSLDLKMLFETRVAWTLLFGLTASAAAHQYEVLGRVTPQMWFMLLAHFIYANAVHKGEECIPTTWDIFHEKFGWMLVFWNGAGVPYVYCFQSWFIATHSPNEIGLADWKVALLAVWLLTAYYFWDVIQKQRNSFRMKLNGTWIARNTFPQFNAGVLDPANARSLKTKSGFLLLADGLWAYGRKLHYTCDVAMALSWGLVCGFTHVLPYFYVLFFSIMITHRTLRDIYKCEQKYGDDWTRYKEMVPWLFIPYVF